MGLLIPWSKPSKKEDFKFDEERKRVWLTPKGAHAAEAFLAIPNLYDPQYRDLVRHISLALQVQ